MENCISVIFKFVLVIMVNCFALGKFPFKYSKLICFYRQVSILFSNLFWKFNKKNRYSIIQFEWNFVVSMCHQSDMASLTKRQMQWNSTTLNKTTADTIEWKEKKQNIIREDVRQFLCIFLSRDRKKAFCLHFVLHSWLR